MLREIKEEEYNYLNQLSNYVVSKNTFSKVLGYMKKDRIVGYVDYSIIYEKIEINYIFVIEEERRQNIAFSLLTYIMDSYDFENITLEVNINNKAAIQLYEKLGFKMVAIRPSYYNGIDGYLMERRKI